jgi:AmmeMemoRadiSam system protein B
LLIESSDLITEDETPHIKEHSIEVELPFLKYINKDVDIVPIIISDFLLERFELVGKAIASVVKNSGKNVLIVVSTDMTHYESHEQAKKQDKKAIESILALDPEGLFNRVNEEHISMCGFGPATVALFACKQLGCKKARLVEYKTSGDVTRDKSSVVGYAGIVIE